MTFEITTRVKLLDFDSVVISTSHPRHRLQLHKRMNKKETNKLLTQFVGCVQFLDFCFSVGDEQSCQSSLIRAKIALKQCNDRDEYNWSKTYRKSHTKWIQRNHSYTDIYHDFQECLK